MKAINKTLILAVVTLMSASAFAGETGEKKDINCTGKEEQKVGKVQKSSDVKVGDDAAKDGKAGSTK